VRAWRQGKETTLLLVGWTCNACACCAASSIGRWCSSIHQPEQPLLSFVRGWGRSGDVGIRRVGDLG